MKTNNSTGFSNAAKPLFAQSLEARRLIHGGADHREVETVRGAYVAVRDLPSVQRNVQAKRRIPGLGLSGIAGLESLYQQNPIIVGGGVFPVEKFKASRGSCGRSAEGQKRDSLVR